jgi:cysteine synthase A
MNIQDAKLFKNKNLVGKPEFTSDEATTAETKFDLRSNLIKNKTHKSQLLKLENLAAGFGRTPLVEVSFSYRGKLRKIYGKYEAFNFSGSIKDRIAFHILKTAYEKGEIQPGDLIVEATSGNTGIAFAALGRALGHQVRIYMPDWLSRERYSMMELLGAEVIQFSKEQGGFLRSIDEARKVVKENGNAFCPEQFTNEENIEAHAKYTAKEIVEQLNSLGLKLDHFVAGVGTGGTIMGFLRYCQRNQLEVNCHPLEPANSPTLTTGGKKIGKHRIQGISDEFIPDIVKLSELKEIVSVDDGDATIMAQKLNNAGLSVGISSGANFIGALKLIAEKPENEVVATIFCDSALKYLSTDLCRAEPAKIDFLSNDVELHAVRFIKS